jgi:hypothetical protein
MAEVFLETGEPEIPEAVRPLLGGFFRFEPKKFMLPFWRLSAYPAKLTMSAHRGKQT